MKRLLRWTAVAAASLAILFVAASALAYWLVDVDALVREQIATHQPTIERHLGREVAFQEISTRFFPTLGAEIEEISVAGAGDGEPLLRVRSAGFDLDLWGVLRSGGTRVGLDSIYVDGLELELIRNADGSLSIDDILALHPAKEPAEAEEATEGIDPALLAILQRVAVNEIRIADAKLTLVDHASGDAPVTSVVQQIDLRARDVQLGKALAFSLRAAAFADERNVDFEATVGPIPADLQLDGLPQLRDVRARVTGLDLGPALPYLSLPVRAAVLSADFRLPRLAPTEPAALEGYVALQGLHLEGGTPIDVRLDADLTADLEKMGATIEKIRVQLGTVEIVASGALHDLAGVPRFENFVVRSSKLDPQVLLAAFPMAGASLPAGSKIQGIAALDLRASGTAAQQSLNLGVDLGDLEILLPDLFAKPRGVPLAMRVEGDFSQSSATLRKANLRLDELDLDLTGTVRDFANPTYDFSLAAKPFSMDRLFRLLPQAAEQMSAAQVKAGGKGAIAGHLKGDPGELSANLDVKLEEIDLELPDTTVRGSVQIRAFASGDPAARLQAGLRIDAGDSVIRIPGTLQKEASTPLLVDIVAEKKGDAVDFRKFDVRLAELQLTAKGSLGPDDSSLDVVMPRLDLEQFARTVPLLPADLVRDGSVEGALRVSGNPAAPETMVVELQKLALKLGASDLRATATVRNLAAPDVLAQVDSRFLDLDALLPADEADAAAGAKEQREDAPALKELRVVAGFALDRVRMKKRLLENVRGRLVVENGVLRVKQATFDLYGGKVRATGTEAEIWRGAMPFKARLVATDVDVGHLIAGEFDSTGLLSGKGNLDVELDGEGFDMESLQEHLTGGWSLALQNGRLSTASITSSVLGGLGALPGIAPQQLASEGDLRDLLAGFVVEKGRMNLRKPMKLQLDGSKVELDGAVGIGGDLFLDGTYFVSPELVSRMTGGRCQIGEEEPVPLRITGNASKPAIRPDAKALGVLVAKGCLSGKAQEAVDRLTGGAAKEAIGKAEAQLEEASAAAQQKADEVKAEAEKQKKAAEDQARKKAEDAAKKLKGKLGF